MSAIIATAAVPTHARLDQADTAPLSVPPSPPQEQIDPTTVRLWAEELHPWWCSEEYATGCGTHMSALDGVIATADRSDISPDGWAPLVSVAAYMGEDGTQGVQVHMMRRGGEAWATFTANEWRQIVAQGEKALGLIGSDPKMAPLPTWPGDTGTDGAA